MDKRFQNLDMAESSSNEHSSDIQIKENSNKPRTSETSDTASFESSNEAVSDFRNKFICRFSSEMEYDLQKNKEQNDSLHKPRSSPLLNKPTSHKKVGTSNEIRKRKVSESKQQKPSEVKFDCGCTHEKCDKKLKQINLVLILLFIM